MESIKRLREIAERVDKMQKEGLGEMRRWSGLESERKFSLCLTKSWRGKMMWRLQTKEKPFKKFNH